MLITNMDVKDYMCNGSIGTLQGVIKDRQGEVKVLMVKFDNHNSGKELQRCHPNYVKKTSRLYTNYEAGS